MIEKMTQEAMDNYLDQTLIEAYDMIILDNDPWPSSFESKKKIKFIQQLVEYFQGREEYERCAQLLTIQKKVIHELDNRKPSN
tara:strand:- start:1266 stop:1514 length:249 start_codon:yes stop_codon:yes gene_type:complete